MSFEALLREIEALPRVMHLEIQGEHYTKTYQHSFGAPAAKRALSLELVGLCYLYDPLEALYTRANGMHLFHSESEDTDDGNCFIPSIALYPFERWAAETAYMQSQIDAEMENDALMNAPSTEPVYSKGMVIGEAVGTGNSFVLLRRGALKGKIIYADHDPDINDWHMNPFAESLLHFMEQIAMPPYQGIVNLCGASRVWF